MAPTSTRSAVPPPQGDAIVGDDDGGGGEIVDDLTERVRVSGAGPPPMPPSSTPPPVSGIRSRKETLASPIPALLAASMGSIDEAPPIPTWVGGNETPRLESSERRLLLSLEDGRAPDGDDDGYLVEIDPPDASSTPVK